MKLDNYNANRIEYGKASNGTLRIIGILHDVDDYVLLEKPRRFYKIYQCNDKGYGNCYFIKNKCKYYLQEFFKEN